MSDLIISKGIEDRILLIRGQKGMLDRDLAQLYGVSTKVLNQAVKRNLNRFPADFMFQLTEEEQEEVVTICDHLKALKFSYQLPHVFTEQGVAMLSSVLNSEKAIEVNIVIMRVFVRIRQIFIAHKELAEKIMELDEKYGKHDGQIHAIFGVIRKLIAGPRKRTRKIGFIP
ncbi:MAG: ORF6N domain-containing protein [Candidatus Saganbacteria bacterium]|nr:ORF6N domain-containing protein [Candidatus Saganbacteria bacterium]